MIKATVTITAADERALAAALVSAGRALVTEGKSYTMENEKRWSMTASRHSAPEPSDG